MKLNIFTEEDVEDDDGYLLTTSASTLQTQDSIVADEYNPQENDYTIDPSNLTYSLLFTDLCDLYERLMVTSSAQEKFSLIFNVDLYKKIGRNSSLYPLIRLLIPSADYGYNNYNLKESTIGKIYIYCLKLEKQSLDYKKLKNWKDNCLQSFTLNQFNQTNNQQKNQFNDQYISSDFSIILYNILEKRLLNNKRSSITLGNINYYLNLLNQNRHNSKEKINIFQRYIVNSLSAKEQMWFIRILFHNMKIGLNFKTLLNSLYKNAFKRFNECLNLRKICEYLLFISNKKNLDEKLQINSTSSFGLKVFMPFFPMLSKGFASSGLNQMLRIEECLNNEPFVMDLKLDGERILFHLNTQYQFKFYTRKGNDFTNFYTPLGGNIAMSVRRKQELNEKLLSQSQGFDQSSQSVSFSQPTGSPFISSTTSGNFSLILDGEVCAMNATTKLYLPFGTNRTVGKNEIEFGEKMPRNDYTWYKRLNAWMIYILFDILYFSGPNSDKLIEIALKDCGFNLDQILKMKLKHFQDHFNTATSSNTTFSLSTFVPPPSFSRLSGDITYLPLVVRRKLLELLIDPEPYRVEFVPCRYVLSQKKEERFKELESYFHHIAIEGKREGIVIKKLLSPYTLGEDSRYLGDWIKMKPEYGELTEEIDLALLGAYFGTSGENYRSKGLSQFLLGSINDIDGPSINDFQSQTSKDSQYQVTNNVMSFNWKDPSQTNCPISSKSIKFHTLCKVGSGYSFKLLERLRQQIKTACIKWNTLPKDTVPQHFSPWFPKHQDIPHVFFDIDFDSVNYDGEINLNNGILDNSNFFETFNHNENKIPLIVFTIKCAEITPSNSFSAGITCRFPRVTRIRLDKNIDSICRTSYAKNMLKGVIKDFAPVPKTLSSTPAYAIPNSEKSKNTVNWGLEESQFIMKTTGISLQVDEVSDKENDENDYDFDFNADDINLEEDSVVPVSMIAKNQEKADDVFFYDKEIHQIAPAELLDQNHLNMFTRWMESKEIVTKKIENFKKNSKLLNIKKRSILTDDFNFFPESEIKENEDDKNKSKEIKRPKIEEQDQLFCGLRVILFDDVYISINIIGNKISYKKQQLAEMLQDYGAYVETSNPSKETLIITSDERSFKLKSFIDNNTHTIIHFKYFTDSINKKKRLNTYPYILSIDYDSLLLNSKSFSFDAIYDSNTDDLTQEETAIFLQLFEHKMDILRIKKEYFSLVRKTRKNEIQEDYEIRKKYFEIFEKENLNYYQKISNYSWKDIYATELDHEDQSYFKDFFTSMYFKNIHIYLDYSSNLSYVQRLQLDNLTLRLRAHGANLHSEIEGNTSHIVMIEENPERLKSLHDIVSSLRLSSPIFYDKKFLNKSWLLISLEKEFFVDPQPEHYLQMPEIEVPTFTSAPSLASIHSNFNSF